MSSKRFALRRKIESAGVLALSATAGIGILITVAVTVSILFEALRFFELVNPLDFLFGTSWNPQMAMTTEQEVGKSSFGSVPVFLGTLLITLIAMAVAVPLGIMGAIQLCFYVKPRTRDFLKPILEVIAGVPTVVYGYFAVIFVAPFFKLLFSSLGFEIASESALAAGFVMGVMIIPFVLSLTDDALNSVPQALKDGALAMGSTKSEMVKKVVLPSAMPSIIGAVILAVSRAIGETMIVVMAAGLVAKLSFNPLDSVTTATAQIVTLLVGDQEFNSPKTLAAFALALTLFIITFIFNIVALAVIKNYKKKYG
ncbi:MAG: phosphate ABC transporter permease subunit PstC [Alphaproteobacteria bacterium]|nr:phosphate ABC transporter permease subunit PstC [Alphaproteobacteria bacterium]